MSDAEASPAQTPSSLSELATGSKDPGGAGSPWAKMATELVAVKAEYEIEHQHQNCEGEDAEEDGVCRKLRLVGLIASMTRLGMQSTTVVSVVILSWITRSQLFTFKKLNPQWLIMHQNVATFPSKMALLIGNILYKMSFTVSMPPA